MEVAFRRGYQAGDVIGYTLVVLATSNQQLEQEIITECERYRVHYNCISDPTKSSFDFGATAVQNGVEVGVHT